MVNLLHCRVVADLEKITGGEIYIEDLFNKQTEEAML